MAFGYTILGFGSGAAGGPSINAQWSGNSIFYSSFGIYTSGANFYVNGGDQLTATTSGTFPDADSIGGNAEDMNGVGGNGASNLRGGRKSPIQWGGYTVTYTIGSGFTGTSVYSSMGIESSGGLLRTRNGGRSGGLISLT
jgi:hypothetical protein